jgi:predicted MPP superfamily phosphohydrolase
MQRRLELEGYFERSGRTLRKGRFPLWFATKVKPVLITAVLAALGLYARGRRNAMQPIVRRIDIKVRHLPPALDGFTILHLSDFHIDKMGDLAGRAATLLRTLSPDLCLLTGDYRYEIDGPCSGVYGPMRTILASISARHGIYGILGNHDAGEIALGLEPMGVRMLVNESARLQHRGAAFWLVGLDDPFDYRCADWEAGMSEVPSDAFVVALVHTPELFQEAARRGVRLYLCGHTHAGQIRLPLLGAIKKNADCPRKYVQGLWQYKGMQGYTSWGLGCSTVSVRYRCAPEIALLTLRLA